MKTGSRKKGYVYVVFAFFCLCLIFVSCKRGSQDTAVESTESFMIIYDKPDTYSYIPIAIKKIANEGYIILGMIERIPYLLKVDEQGNFLWDTGVDTFAQYLDPVTDLLILNGDYYFFCNRAYGRERVIILLKYSEITGIPQEIPFADDLFLVENPDSTDKNRTIFPLHTSKITDDLILFLAFDEPNKRILIRKMEVDGERIWKDKNESGFRDICQYKHSIQDRRYHFSGMVENDGSHFYYFQSFSRRLIYDLRNVCFRFVKINPQTGDFYEKYWMQNPFIAMELHGSAPDGVNFSGAQIDIDNGYVFFYVNSKIKDKENTAAEKIQIEPATKYRQFELIETKTVYIKTMEVDDQQVVFFVGSSKEGKIVLYAYGHSSRTLLDKKYFGETNIYEAAGLTGENDGGLAILGTTYIDGQLGRICLFKLSQAELEDMVMQ